MRYLKTYKLFESYFKSDFIDDIKDLTLDLSDEGFEVYVHEVDYTPTDKSGSIKAIAVDLKPSNMFSWSDIKDSVERIEEYCWRKDEGYEIDVEVVSDDEFIDLNQFISIYGSEEIESEISLLIYSVKDYLEKYGDYGMNESIDTIREYINDILLPLEDDGFEIKIQDTGTSTSFFIGNNPNGYITQSEIKVVEHLYNYLTEMGYKPYGKNILDDLDINFEVFSKNFKNLKNTKTMMYKRFIHFLENTDSKVNWIKFSFWNAKN